ncbi:hypothetical protein ACFV4K_34380 [Nocardia sp. NPDC059764]|uniref:hypothetical protein n=1 Tax=Nocardia sp. NPDC059764 TaxID=3346939 RepID=UPI003651B200
MVRYPITSRQAEQGRGRVALRRTADDVARAGLARLSAGGVEHIVRFRRPEEQVRFGLRMSMTGSSSAGRLGE